MDSMGPGNTWDFFPESSPFLASQAIRSFAGLRLDSRATTRSSAWQWHQKKGSSLGCPWNLVATLQKINMEPENDGLEDYFLFQKCILRFYVNLLGCRSVSRWNIVKFHPWVQGVVSPPPNVAYNLKFYLPKCLQKNVPAGHPRTKYRPFNNVPSKLLNILLMEDILHQLRLVVFPIICKGLYIPGG